MIRNKVMRPAFKIHGGKHFLAKWIIEHFPENYKELDYVEPCCGAGSVLLNKEPSNFEVIADVDIGIIQIFRALRDEPALFKSKLSHTKYCENTFSKALKKTEHEDYIEHAVNDFILRRMSRGGLKKSFAWSERERGGQPGDVNAWKTCIKECLPEICERIKNISIVHKPVLEVVKAFDEINTLFYVDPPYLPDTRQAKNAYEHEMSVEYHVDLHKVLEQSRARVVLSGYPSPLYKRLFKNWRCVTKKIANHASQKKVKEKKTEALWMNYDATGKLLRETVK